MLKNGRMAKALTVSLIINVACVAWLGGSGVLHASLTPPPPRPHDRTDALHPVPLKLAEETKQTSNAGMGKGGTQNGESGADASGSNQNANGGADSSQGHNNEQAGLSAGDSDSTLPPTLANQIRAELKAHPLTANQKRMAQWIVEQEKKQEAGHKNAPPLTAAQHEKELQRIGEKLNARFGSRAVTSFEHAAMTRLAATPSLASAIQQQSNGPSGYNAASALTNKPAGLSNKSAMDGQGRGGNKKLAMITHPSGGGKGGHSGVPGASISPKMVKYPKMKINLGTIHETRPKSGGTGGGYADMRDVEVTAHYVIDDPKNIPKTYAPDKFVKLFVTHCSGDPGNTSRCVHVGGNTSFGGIVLHGAHNHITGTKYCVAGIGGLPGVPGASGDPGKTGVKGGENRMGPGGRRYVPSETFQPGANMPFNNMQLAKHGDFTGMIPGAKVPVIDRKWVYNPEAHTDAATPGPRAEPMPRFTINPRDIGSTSTLGTVVWEKPHPLKHPKKPYGGDGSGLLGTYYRGINFDTPMFSRPDRNIDFDWSSAGPNDPRIPTYTAYSVRWEGKLIPRFSEAYQIQTTSDDGVRVYIDDQSVISNWDDTLRTVTSSPIDMVAGREYKIRVEYFENGRPPAWMRLAWSSPSQPLEYIPEQCLRYPKPGGSGSAGQ